MTEKLLQFIWQFQYFNRQSLCTMQAEALQILSPGQLNTQQGPDFDQARIIIGRTTWAGQIELHMRSSDWLRHGHQNDERYKKVILHVVWHHDTDIAQPNGEPIPTLELQPRVASLLLNTYDQWMQTPQAIACAGSFNTVPSLTWQSWKERLLIERLIKKYQLIQHHLLQTHHHWEEVCWRMVCRYFGGNTNAVSFEQVAVSLSIEILARHKNQIHQLEALLLGQAGLLHKNLKDEYAQLLYREYQFLQQKYGLRVVNLPPSFLRMRPVNFPTIRLAQLAMLIYQSQHLFSKIKEAEQIEQVRQMFNVTANDYWHYHYRFDEATPFHPKTFGDQMFDTLLINAIVPVLFSYGKYTNETAIQDKALRWLEQIQAEKNSVIQPFLQLGLQPENAYDSQAMLQLKKEYCDAKRCLECGIGNAILRKAGL